MKIKAIDFFCGAGGVTRGLLDAGIDVIAGVDFDNSVKDTYEKNNEPAKFIPGDITNFTKEDIDKIFNGHEGKTLLAGCAPCQPFSKKNKNRHNSKDPRRTLLRNFADLVAETEPDFVFMENVSGLANLEGDVLEYFLDILDKHGYSHKEKVVNAVNYGVPQNRKRYVLLASKYGTVEIPEGAHNGKNVPFKTVEDTIKELPPLKAGDEDLSILNHKCSSLQPITLKRIRATKHDGGSRSTWDDKLWLKCHLDENGNPKNGHNDVYGRMAWKKPSPTLTTKFYNYSTGRYGHPEQDRAISLKEGALLQSFPKSYVFHGNLTQIARQIGNAVPPKMAKAFGNYFFKLLHS